MITAGYNDKALVIELLCNSFDTNKSVNYIVGQGIGRKNRIKRLMAYSFDVCYSFGQIYLSDDKQACALLLFSDKRKNNFKNTMRDLGLIFSCIGVSRVKKVLIRDAKIKRSYPKAPIVYLWFIAVDPKVQHKGMGTALLKGVIKVSESLERPIYLETSMQENLAFYNRLGFKIYHELNFDHKLFLLRRTL